MYWELEVARVRAVVTNAAVRGATAGRTAAYAARGIREDEAMAERIILCR
jgi:hypothetical protein